METVAPLIKQYEKSSVVSGALVPTNEKSLPGDKKTSISGSRTIKNSSEKPWIGALTHSKENFKLSKISYN